MKWGYLGHPWMLVDKAVIMGPCHPQPKTQVPKLCLSPPTPMFSASETQGSEEETARKEPQGHDAEHGLLTHVADQDLGGFFKD